MRDQEIRKGILYLLGVPVRASEHGAPAGVAQHPTLVVGAHVEADIAPKRCNQPQLESRTDRCQS
ncbi:MAG: hypothetical protein JWP08_970 [Bryobacterales bacterium]|jgi:hypothetical protein|nr:hypothetical protein [Bryobacterales bacterium]